MAKVVSIGIQRRLYHDEHAPADAVPTENVAEGARCEDCGEPVAKKVPAKGEPEPPKKPGKK